MMACATTPPALPETTGEELGVYLLDGKVVDAEGNEYLSADGMAQYYLDAAGNVVTEIAACEHDYRDEVVAPTEQAEGYTLPLCTKCGYSYRDTYTAKLPCSHIYAERLVAATCTSEGYTLHTCKVCQANYKDNYTGVKAHSYTVTVIAPTYTAEGYTNHICSVCGSSYGIIYLTKRNSLSAGNIAVERLFYVRCIPSTP